MGLGYSCEENPTTRKGNSRDMGKACLWDALQRAFAASVPTPNAYEACGGVTDMKRKGQTTHLQAFSGHRTPVPQTSHAAFPESHEGNIPRCVERVALPQMVHPALPTDILQ